MEKRWCGLLCKHVDSTVPQIATFIFNKKFNLCDIELIYEEPKFQYNRNKNHYRTYLVYIMTVLFLLDAK